MNGDSLVNSEKSLPADFQFAPDGFGSRSACIDSGATHFNWFNRQKSSQTVNLPALLFLYKKTNHSGYIVNRAKIAKTEMNHKKKSSDLKKKHVEFFLNSRRAFLKTRRVFSQFSPGIFVLISVQVLLLFAIQELFLMEEKYILQ